MNEPEREIYDQILKSLGRIEKLTRDDRDRRDEIRTLRLRYFQRIEFELSRIRYALEVLTSKPSAG